MRGFGWGSCLARMVNVFLESGSLSFSVLTLLGRGCGCGCGSEDD